MGVVCHFLAFRKEQVVIIYPTWTNNRNLGRIKIRNFLPAMEIKLGKLKQKKQHLRPRECKFSPGNPRGNISLIGTKKAGQTKLTK